MVMELIIEQTDLTVEQLIEKLNVVKDKSSKVSICISDPRGKKVASGFTISDLGKKVILEVEAEFSMYANLENQKEPTILEVMSEQTDDTVNSIFRFLNEQEKDAPNEDVKQFIKQLINCAISTVNYP